MPLKAPPSGHFVSKLETGRNRSYSPLFARSRKSPSVSCKDGPILCKLNFYAHATDAEAVQILRLLHKPGDAFLTGQPFLKGHTADIGKRVCVGCANIDALHFIKFLRGKSHGKTSSF